VASFANLTDDSLHFLNRSGRSIDIGLAQTRTQQMVVTEDIEWQIAVVVIETMEEASFLPAMDRKVG
jgi:hypothetical protein